MKTVIEMAREVGFKASTGKTDKEGVYHPYINALGKDIPVEWLGRFAELVRADAIADEREACAKLVEQGLPIASSLSALDDMEMWGEKFAAAIRARGNT